MGDSLFPFRTKVNGANFLDSVHLLFMYCHVLSYWFSCIVLLFNHCLIILTIKSTCSHMDGVICCVHYFRRCTYQKCICSYPSVANCHDSCQLSSVSWNCSDITEFGGQGLFCITTVMSGNFISVTEKCLVVSVCVNEVQNTSWFLMLLVIKILCLQNKN